ncbi:MAG: GNAT family N-acetyltransferase, partial [Gammaproteobacteria bacterium]|nr:GNAT family N-acetyltransferase [Gammaproteobacteria bacterium]
IPCRSLQRSDLAALVRIDRKVLGRDRSGYYECKLAEVLDESGIRVSLATEVDGMVSGFIMARVDFGEFGRAEPYAVLDTMSVDPGLQHRRIATALLSQLLANLTTLRVERLRSEAAFDQRGLFAFLWHCDFRPSQQLPFCLTLG